MEYLNTKLSQSELNNTFFKPYNAHKMSCHSTLNFLKKENAKFLDTEKIQRPFMYDELNTLGL